MTELCLQATRQQRGLAQVDVAVVLDRSESWVSRVETGEIPLTLPDLVRFARLYQAHPWDLVLFRHVPPPQHWPVPLCADCEARCAEAWADPTGEPHDATPAQTP